MAKKVAFFSFKNLLLISLLVIFNLLLFDDVSHKITRKWQLFFSYYDGFRLPASISAFVPFAADVIREKHSGKTIIFTGDSTSGGLLYHHSQAIPAYLQEQLIKSGKNVRTFNLPLSGAHLSEQYFMMKEFADEADVIIFPIHYSFFTGRGANGSFISHPDLVSYLSRLDQTDVAPLGLSAENKFEQTLDTLVGKIWYSYRVRRIMPYIVLGKPLPAWLRERLFSLLPQKADSPKVESFTVNQDLPFFQQMPRVKQEILAQNVLLWQKTDYIDDQNINLLYLRKIGALKHKSGKKFYAYFVPLDMKTLKDNQILDTAKYRQIIARAKMVLGEFGIPYLDFTADNPAGIAADDFYNPDHLLPRGNAKVGKFLAREIAHDF